MLTGLGPKCDEQDLRPRTNFSFFHTLSYSSYRHYYSFVSCLCFGGEERHRTFMTLNYYWRRKKSMPDKVVVREIDHRALIIGNNRHSSVIVRVCSSDHMFTPPWVLAIRAMPKHSLSGHSECVKRGWERERKEGKAGDRKECRVYRQHYFSTPGSKRENCRGFGGMGPGWWEFPELKSKCEPSCRVDEVYGVT